MVDCGDPPLKNKSPPYLRRVQCFVVVTNAKNIVTNIRLVLIIPNLFRFLLRVFVMAAMANKPLHRKKARVGSFSPSSSNVVTGDSFS